MKWCQTGPRLYLIVIIFVMVIEIIFIKSGISWGKLSVWGFENVFFSLFEQNVANMSFHHSHEVADKDVRYFRTVGTV